MHVEVSDILCHHDVGSCWWEKSVNRKPAHHNFLLWLCFDHDEQRTPWATYRDLSSIMSSRDSEKDLSALLLASFETFVHQLLFKKNVYPAESFCRTKFLGITTQTNRHEGVVKYISETLEYALPVMLQEGGKVIIRIEPKAYVLSFATAPSVASIASVESQLRDLILSIHAMEQEKRVCHTGFQIQLVPAQQIPKLGQAMDAGAWFQVEQDVRQQKFLRPIFSSCREDFGVSLIVEQQQSSLSADSTKDATW